MAFQYIIFYKPFNVLSQFTSPEGKPTIADFGPFPKNVYAVGRLDFDSEGLLLLTDDKVLTHRLLEPKFEHPRTYMAQVEGIPAEEELQKLRDGVLIEGIMTKPAQARLAVPEPVFPPRSVPIRFRKELPTSWLELTLTEGRNRQVRKMTAAAGHPTLRLIRTRIGPLTLEGLAPGQSRVLSTGESDTLRAFAFEHS